MELEKAGAGCVNKNDPRKCRYISLQKRLCSLRSSFIWRGGIPMWENTLMMCRHFRQIDVTARRDHYFCSPQKGQADCGYAIAGNGVLAVFSLLILLLDAKVRVNGTKQRALLINALRLDENFCRLVQFCFPKWSDAVSTTSASEYDAI